MRWRDLRRSRNIEDRRSQRPSRFPFPFGRGRGTQIRFPGASRGTRGRRGGGIGIIGMLIILGLMFFLGVDPRVILQGQGDGPGLPLPRQVGLDQPGTKTAPKPGSAAKDEMAQFVAAVLGATEDIWREQFRQMNRRYREPKLIMYRGSTRTACGRGMAAMGPFYCPADQTVYIDLSFYQTLKRKFGAAGDFAQAYVIAHEIGHHVQTLMGISDQVRRLKARASKLEGNRIQVRMELQADCLAGIWAHYANQRRTKTGLPVLEQGDIEEALNAASAIGDDAIQRKMQGYVVEDSFTHGSSAQRREWFGRGFQSGKYESCNTGLSRAS